MPTASPAELRRAYLSRARRFHPDGFVDAPAGEKARAEKRMRELNAAWAVLGDPTRRAAYDRSLMRELARPTGPVAGRSPSAPPRAPSAPPPRPQPRVATREEMEIRGLARIVRPVPLLLIGVVVAVALIVTAALGGGGDGPRERTTTPPGTPLGCISLAPLAVEVPCGDHEAVVWSIVEAGQSCGSGLEPIYRDGLGGLFCVTLVEE